MRTSAQPVHRSARPGKPLAAARSQAPSKDRPLPIGPVGDLYEQEADRLSGAPPSSRSGGSAGPAFAPPAVRDVLSSPGQALHPGLRASLEPRFGFDFSRVRVHADPRAAESARSVGALAYTVGTDIAFASGQYQPGSSRGRELIAHELTHVVQQQALGPVLQRQTPPGAPAPAAPAAPAPTEEDLQKVLEQFKAELGRDVPAWLQEWARKSQASAGRTPSLDEIRSAMNIKKFQNAEPPILKKEGTPEEPEKLPPGAIGANEILPFTKGSRVLVTQLLEKVITEDLKARVKALIEMFKPAAKDTGNADKNKPDAGASGNSGNLTDVLQEQGVLLLDLFTDPEITRSVTAEVTESLPQRFEAKVAIPAIPAKGSRPALSATEVEFTLERSGDSFLVMVFWKRGDKKDRLPLLYVTATRGTNGEIVVKKKEGGGATLEIVGKPGGGGLTFQLTNIPDVAKAILEVDEPLKVVQMEQLGAPAGSAAEAKEKEKRVEQARSQAQSPGGNNELLYGSGLQYQYGGAPASQGADPAMFLGWRFTFKPLGKLLQVPVQVQLDYLPPAGGFGQASTGVQTVLPTRVPVTLRVLGGLRAGAAQGNDPAAGATPAVGPVVGGGAGVEIGPKVNIEVQVDKFWNLVKDGAKKGPEDAVGVQLGAAVRF